MLQQLDTLIGFVVVMSVVSLLITILAQIGSGFLALRGRHLQHALETTFSTLAPTVATNAKALAEEILTHPVVSDSAWKCVRDLRLPLLKRHAFATAIRPQEVIAILEAIAGGTSTSKSDATTVLTALKTATSASNAAMTELQAQLGNLAGGALLSAQAKLAELKDHTQVALRNLTGWFEAAQDRAQQRFGTHMRLITILASVATAFVLQLDTFALLRRISSDSDVRGRLVAGASALQLEAERVFNETDPTNRKLHAAVLAALPAGFNDLKTKLGTAPKFQLQREIEAWIREQLAGEKAARVEEFVEAYREEAQAEIESRLERMRERFGAVSSKFSQSGLSLWPTPYPGFGKWSWPLPRLFGILASAALLSLGAPFWFNTLKSLTNLRPLVAEKVEKKPQLNGAAF